MARPPMEIAANGLGRIGDAAVNAVQLAKHTMPQWFTLAERFVDTFERAVDVAEDASVRSGAASAETIVRASERAQKWALDNAPESDG